MVKNSPRVYFGEGGFAGMSEQRRSRETRQPSMVKKVPSVYMGGTMSGVSTRKVLGVGGIVGSRAVEVKAKAEKPKVVVAAVSSPKAEKKSEKCMPPMDERGNGCNEKITEKEERLADFLEAAEETKAKCEETDASSEPPASLVEEMIKNADPPPTEEPTSTAVLPELPLGEAVPAEGKRRKKRRRKHHKADEGLNFE